MSHCFFILRRCLLCTAVALAAGTAHAADPLTLDEAQRIAVSRSQQLVANEASGSAARRMADAAVQLPDPVLKLGIDNLPVNGPDRLSLTRDFMTMRRIGLMQEWPSAEKRSLRARRLAADAIRIQEERKLTAANVRRDTALAWLDRYYALATRQLIVRQIEETKLQVQASETAYRAARGSQADVFAARAALSLLEDRLSQSDRQARNAVLMLGRWIGADAERLPTGAPPWTSTYLEKDITTDHLKTHPDIAVAAAQVGIAEAEVRVAQANKSADWTVEASYSQRGSAYSNMVSLGVSIPLQLDQANRQDQELGAKLALVRDAQARYEDMLRSHEAEVRMMLNDWQTGKDRLVRYSDTLVPLAQQRSDAALTAYRTGKGDLAAALTARRDELDVRMQALTLEMETARVWAQLNFISSEHDTAATHQEKP